MDINTIQINSILNNSCNLLSREKNYINNLNVFPVPDGDTGLNMILTVRGALNSIKSHSFKAMSIQEYVACFAEGALLNSRGCSGSILALFCKGISDSIKLTDGTESISNNKLSAALKKGCETAYQNTINPTEGTMLTMMRVLSEKFEQLSSDSSNNTLYLIKKNYSQLGRDSKKYTGNASSTEKSRCCRFRSNGISNFGQRDIF